MISLELENHCQVCTCTQFMEQSHMYTTDVYNIMSLKKGKLYTTQLRFSTQCKAQYKFPLFHLKWNALLISQTYIAWHFPWTMHFCWMESSMFCLTKLKWRRFKTRILLNVIPFQTLLFSRNVKKLSSYNSLLYLNANVIYLKCKS